MATPETEKQLSDLSTDYIYSEGTGNLLLLAISVIDRKLGEGAQLPYDIPEEIKAVREKADEYITRLEDILGSEDERFEALNEVAGLKNEVITLYKNIYDYYSEWNMLSTPLHDEVAMRKYKEDHLGFKQVQYDMFYKDCINFLTSSENIYELRKYTAQILKCMPMRMARARFFDIIHRSLKAAFENESEDCIVKSLDAFKRGCAPSLYESYGKIFPEIADWIKNKKDFNPAHADDEELAVEYENFNLMLETLQHIEDYFTELYDDLNSLIIVLYLSFTFEELTEGDPVYSDLFHAVVDIMTGEVSEEEAETMYETLKEQLEGAFEPIIDKVNAINDKEIALIEQVGSVSALSEDTQKSVSAEGFIRGLYYSNINDDIFNFDIDENSPKASAEFSAKEFNGFVDAMKEYYQTLPSHVRKSNMLMLLGSIPVTMDIPDTMDYIKASVENCIDNEQKLLIVDKCGLMFTSNGFKYADEHDECGCGHDHHHDDCGCGHEHHHHDDCGCGHEHHHDHDCGCGHEH